MGAFWLPNLVISSLEQSIMDFLWHGSSENWKIHLVNWQKTLLPQNVRWSWYTKAQRYEYIYIIQIYLVHLHTTLINLQQSITSQVSGYEGA